MTLSICMIVKNEEKNLERCLNSLRPLLDGLDSELIITDTGSTDRTVAIARCYTDRILHFDWCNDFAKARNYGIERANGEWLMTIDADEELIDDLSEIIEFFQSDRKDRYVCAGGTMKNVLDPSDRDKMTNEQNVVHFYRMDQNPRFEGAIHETIPIQEPYYQFGFLGYHYGYAFTSEEEIIEKKKRNMPLIQKQLESDPNDIRTLIFALESAYDDEGKRIFLYRLEKELQKTKGELLLLAGYKPIIEFYLETKEWKKVVEIGKKVEKSVVAKKREYEAVQVDIFYPMTLAFYYLQQYAQAMQYAQKYLTLYEQYEKGLIERTVLTYITVNSFYESRYREIESLRGAILFQQGREQEGKKALDRIDDWSVVSPELYYMAFHSKLDLPKQAYRQSQTRIAKISYDILTNHVEDVVETVEALCRWIEEEPIALEKMVVCSDFLKRAVPYVEQNKTVQKRLLQSYRNLMKQLLNAIYRPEVLQEQTVELFPKAYQVGYWTERLFVALESKESDCLERCRKQLETLDQAMGKALDSLIQEEWT